jgi:hypothetical protein
MSEDISPEARAEIEQGKCYRDRRSRWAIPHIPQFDQDKVELWCCALLLLGGLYFANGGREWIVYWHRPTTYIVRFIPVVLICFLAFWIVWKSSNWKKYLLVRAGCTVAFSLLIPLVFISSWLAINFRLEGDIEHISSVRYHGHVYHLERFSFSGIYYNIWECDRAGILCREVYCFPYEEAEATEPVREFASYVRICSTGEYLPGTSP